MSLLSLAAVSLSKSPACAFEPEKGLLMIGGKMKNQEKYK